MLLRNFRPLIFRAGWFFCWKVFNPVIVQDYSWFLIFWLHRLMGWSCYFVSNLLICWRIGRFLIVFRGNHRVVILDCWLLGGGYCFDGMIFIDLSVRLPLFVQKVFVKRWGSIVCVVFHCCFWVISFKLLGYIDQMGLLFVWIFLERLWFFDIYRYILFSFYGVLFFVFIWGCRHLILVVWNVIGWVSIDFGWWWVICFLLLDGCFYFCRWFCWFMFFCGCVLIGSLFFYSFYFIICINFDIGMRGWGGISLRDGADWNG